MSPLSKRQWRFFLAVAARVAPPCERLDPAGQARFNAIVGKALAARPRSLQRQFRLFLTLLRWGPALRFGASFDRLEPVRQDAVLRWLLDAPILKLRSGFWGVRALAFMGLYGQPEVWPALRYAPSFNGNRFLHD
ncbi:MAG: hypothetical protein LAO05_00100 [Acidobacteriia bacterium]|nr:hypothetical protein [Terriglobia bacterium]